jgi:hypothetical protein
MIQSHQSACANDGEITEYRATVHISFELDAKAATEMS